MGWVQIGVGVAVLVLSWLAGCVVGWFSAQAWELYRPRSTAGMDDDNWPPFSRN